MECIAYDQPVNADAYTYLGIARGNKWGIRASIYDTKTLLAKN